MKNTSRILVAIDSSRSSRGFTQTRARPMLALVATAMLVLAFSSAAAAQTGAVLSGVVHNRTGEPVSGVVLTIEDPITGDTRVAISDSRGMYFVDRLHYGTQYAVDVSHPRFRESRMWASANEGDTAVDIALVPQRSAFVRVLLFPLRVLTFGVIE